MTDWDKDGKTDWHDAYVFNEIIDKKPAGTHTPSSFSPSSGSGWLWFILLLFLILISK